MAVLETQLQNVRERLGEVDAAGRETVKEFRVAIEKHKDDHITQVKESANTRWKWISAILALLAVADPVLVLIAKRLLGL
jgi:hypothetical protein